MIGTTAQKLQAILDSKSDIKDAIEAKGVTVGDATLAEYASKIGEIPAPMKEAPENDVNFYDYDGFRVASYTIAEAKALTELPTPPTHEGLTFQEWNWSLNDIQTYDRQYADIGANYITNDGNTYLLIKVEAGQTFPLTLAKIRTTNYVISWGDNSPNETSTNGDTASFSHTYTNAGNYKVTISPVDTSPGFRITSPLSDVYKIYTGAGFYLSKSICFGTISTHKDCASSSSPLSNNYLNTLYYKFLVLPKGSYSTKNTNFKYNSTGCVCFPQTVDDIFGTRWMNANFSQQRLVVPNTKDSSDSLKNDSVSSMRFLRILSIPNIAISYSNPFVNNVFLEYIDVVQGWIPSMDLTLSGSKEWSKQNIVRFFNKLGTTTNVITLTFGSTNLDKLTADEKAIATNKGYTLA